jgi:hypothetical protein
VGLPDFAPVGAVVADGHHWISQLHIENREYGVAACQRALAVGRRAKVTTYIKGNNIKKDEG